MKITFAAFLSRFAFTIYGISAQQLIYPLIHFPIWHLWLVIKCQLQMNTTQVWVSTNFQNDPQFFRCREFFLIKRWSRENMYISNIQVNYWSLYSSLNFSKIKLPTDSYFFLSIIIKKIREYYKKITSGKLLRTFSYLGGFSYKNAVELPFQNRFLYDESEMFSDPSISYLYTSVITMFMFYDVPKRAILLVARTPLIVAKSPIDLMTSAWLNHRSIFISVSLDSFEPLE